ncbi:putative FYVE zinc finger, Zinc finger, FYVE/PHD-type, Zinc finger, RING/FYVE/PHD-type [Plasmopara halstedii]
MATMNFPLKTNFFPQIRLTAQERSWYVLMGERSATALRRSVESLDWKQHMEKDGVTYSQAHCIEGSISTAPSIASTIDEEPQTTASAYLMMKATTFATGTIDETLEALASPVTENYRRAMHFLHGSRFIDGVCLHTITQADSKQAISNTQVSTTLKWAAYDDRKLKNSIEGPVGTDYCFIEHSGIHYGDSDNSIDGLFGFSIQESIVRDSEVPSLAGVGLARGHLHRTGIIIMPTDRPDVVQVTSILQMRMTENVALGALTDVNTAVLSSGKPRSAALARLMCRRVAAVGRLELLLERRRLNKLDHLPQAEWVADNVRKTCAVCRKQFTLRRRKHHCRHCGEVVCASCAPKREVETDTNAAINVRLCTACVVQSRMKLQEARGFRIPLSSMRDADSSSVSPSLSNMTETFWPMTHSDNVETKTRSVALSSGSSSFSILSDLHSSSRIMCKGHTDEAIDYEDDLVKVSSGNSSSYSLSEFDSIDSLVSTSESTQVERDCQLVQCSISSERIGSRYYSTCSPHSLGSCTLPSDDLLERIQSMKTNLSILRNSCDHLRSASFRMGNGADNLSSFVADAEVLTPRPAVEALDSHSELYDVRRRTRSSGYESSLDIDFINTNEQFTLLCPQIGRQWRTQTYSSVHQDPGEKSYVSARLSSMSFVSTMSDSTMLGDEDTPEQPESQNFDCKFLNVEGRGERQAELLALKQKIEVLQRSLAAATSQLDSIQPYRAPSRFRQQLFDPVTAKHETIHRQLVEELHEILGVSSTSQNNS